MNNSIQRGFLLALLSLTCTSASPVPKQCGIVVTTAPTITPGIYRVQVRYPCPGSAQVRLESYVGGTFPRVGWLTITRDAPLIRAGVPWYWRVAREMPSGTIYRVPLPNTSPPPAAAEARP